MAIFHLATKPVRRGTGRSAVAAAAYRAGTRLESEREGITHDFRRRGGVVHAEIVLPEGVDARWARDRAGLWNAAEVAEKRKDARVAREWEIALPHELNAGERLALTREFAKAIADRYGVAVDFAVHAPQADSDVRNHHAHLLVTTRRVTAEGLGAKADIEWDEKRLAAAGISGVRDQIREMRVLWEATANAHLARAGHDVHIDHRSHRARGLTLEPTTHVGVQATGMLRAGGRIARNRFEVEAEARNRALLLKSPEEALSVITDERSVFDERDVARTVRRYLGDTEDAKAVTSSIMASSLLVQLTQAERDESGKILARPRFTSKAMLNLERDMVEASERLHTNRTHGVSARRLDRRLKDNTRLAPEQRDAVRHATGAERIAAVVGLAGAGKTTMLSVAREAWEEEGYRVVGAALAGKAVEGLEASSGIKSRTLASWERRWELGQDLLEKGDVLVIDEAGMVGSAQLKRFIDVAERADAKIVLVGDPAQLQPIAAGAAFRAVTERIGFAEMSEVRRQAEDWQRTASMDLARFRTNEALVAYRDRGAVHLVETRDRALAEAVTAYLADERVASDKSRLLLAYRRADVAALNEEIRAHHKDAGRLKEEVSFAAFDGTRRFAIGDRVLFRETRDGYKNGWLGTVETAAKDKLAVRLDGEDRRITVEARTYDAVDHGYATTIHKAQGATVDRAFVVASKLMDRHLAYVAMTRHRESVKLYAGQDEFRDFDGLSQGLSRAETKETTLDYVARRGLARDRGVLPDGALVRGGGMFETVTRFEAGEDEVARTAVRALAEVKEREAAIAKVAARIYREPDLAARRLITFAESSKERPEDLSERIAAQPDRFGELKGSAGLLAIGAARANRRDALASVRELSVEARLYARAFQNHLPDALGRERARRVAMRVEVPSLSDRARTILEDAERAFLKSDKAFEGNVMRAMNGREGEEIIAFAKATEHRFGDVATAPLDEMKRRVTAADIGKLEAARKLMKAAQRFAREPALAVERAQARTRHMTR